MIHPGSDTGSSLFEMLVALAILALASTLLLTGYSGPRPVAADPVETANGLLLAARFDAILSGDSIVVRLRAETMDVGDQRHSFSSPLKIADGDAGRDVSEFAFVILPDGTRTGGSVRLASEHVQQPVALTPHGTGT